MFKFGREPYSREGYDEATKKAELAKRTYERIGSLSHIKNEVERQNLYDRLHNNQLKAENRLKKMLASGQIEATELNEEYDRLVKQLETAQHELETFSREKLGMTVDEGETAPQ